jgi:hypothetical protein
MQALLLFGLAASKDFSTTTLSLTDSPAGRFQITGF